MQVYSIVACQLALTAVVAAVIMFNEPVQKFVLTNTPFQIINTLLPFLGAALRRLLSAKHHHFAVAGYRTCTYIGQCVVRITTAAVGKFSIAVG